MHASAAPLGAMRSALGLALLAAGAACGCGPSERPSLFPRARAPTHSPPSAALDAGGKAEQVHLSLAPTPDTVHVSFAVADWACPAGSTRLIAYGTSESNLDRTAVAVGVAFSTDIASPLCLFDGDLPGLEANTRYWYRPELGVETFSFVNAPQRKGGNVYAVFGDMGSENDVSAQQLAAEARAGAYDAILYSGDYAYDFTDEDKKLGGNVGSAFMNILEPAAARAPWMGVVGNHERASNYSHWRARFGGFPALAKAAGSESALWYSLNLGLVHFVFFSTEVFSFGGGSPALQQAWLARDLAAVDRSATPWVVAIGHKTPWMSDVDWSGLDPLFRKHGVDLFLAGHTHNYQRIAPADGISKKAKPVACANAAKTVYTDCGVYQCVVAGSPGNWKLEDKPAKKMAPAQLLDGYSPAYGYGHLTVVDAHTLRYEWEETGQRSLVTGLRSLRASAFFDSFEIHRS